MNKKKTPEQESGKETRTKQTDSTPRDAPPSLQSIEGFLAGFDIGRGGKQRAVDEAQEIMHDAWEATTRQRRVALARKALDKSADCADAYVLLAEETAKSLEEAIELYRQGVEAGGRALGKKAFKEALKENTHVPDYLLGRKKMPRHLPGYYGFGDENEVVFYVHGNRAAWDATPGALTWLTAMVK